jgi:hypothetical protein
MRLLLLALVAVLSFGCVTNGNECEEICTRFVTDCGFNAWGGVEQCRIGCVEDLYRRADADEVLACYHAAVDPPTSEQAEALVDRATEAGFFDDRIEAQTFVRADAVTEAIGNGTCDAFAVVQCKVEAVQVRPTAPLLSGGAD